MARASKKKDLVKYRFIYRTEGREKNRWLSGGYGHNGGKKAEPSTPRPRIEPAV